MNTQSSRTIPMVRRFLSLLALLIGGGLITAVSAQQEPAPGAVHALFDLASPSTGPFPSDWFTARDPGNITRLRVNLPFPDCAVRVSDCEDLDVINALDGFNLQPRLSIPFDGAIDVTSVTSNTVFLISLGSMLRDGEDGGARECGGNDTDDDCGRVIGINQVVWDTLTDTLHVESDELLDQDTRYALIATHGILDPQGSAVQASEAFRNFRQNVRGDYKRALLEALRAARRIGVPEGDIIAASMFTTQSATAVMEKIRDQIKAATPEPADFNLGLGGTRTVFPLETLTGITWRQQTRDNPPAFTAVPLDLKLLSIIPGAIGQIAFGKYVSPDYEVHPGEFIPPVATRTGIPTVQSENEVYLDLYLPSGFKPANGWPVAIFGTGNNGSRHNSFFVAAMLASHGIATIAINPVGMGFGPHGTLTVNQTRGDPVTFSSGGRAISQSPPGTPNAPIGANEGFATARPRKIVYFTDGIRQTVADLMQLVRVIQVGIDVDGDGFPDLDPSRIYYVGTSLSSQIGTVFLAIEPSVLAGVLNVPGAANVLQRGLTPLGRSSLGPLLASRIPSLINAPGIVTLDGVSVGPPHFNDNMPWLRDGLPLAVRLADGTTQDIQSPVVNTVAGAIEIQEVIKNIEWVGQPGDAPAYAFHLRKSPLPGVPAKSVVFQFARGDQNGGNPNNSRIVRAGDLADRTTFYRHDLAFAEDSTLAKNPHTFTFFISSPIPLQAAIARGAQEQIARFFASDGQGIMHPEPARFFEVPIVLPLPEDLGFIPSIRTPTTPATSPQRY